VAKDVRYYLRGAFGPRTAYEFSISEDDFLTWCKSKGISPVPITEEKRIERYSFFAKNGDLPKIALITNGWYFQRIVGGDAITKVGYDRDRTRCYYLDTTR
jgi:hypothetical protein